MSYNSVGLMDDALVFTGQCGISKTTVIKGKKWKKFGIDKEDGRYLTGQTKASEFVWCKAFCKTGGHSTIEMAEEIGEIINGTFSQSAVSSRFHKIKRFYLWVCLAFIKEAKRNPGKWGNVNNPYYNAKYAVHGWINYLHTLVNDPKCKTCRDTGLIPKEYHDWDYCTCKMGKERKKSLFNY